MNSVISCSAQQRLRLDLVSPLPPVRSGISDYCDDLLPELARRADVRLVRAPEEALCERLERDYEVIDVDRVGDDGHLPLYHMGNNHHHRWVWSLAMQRPGVLVLHDLVLHHFLIDRTARYGDFDAYETELEACHGWIGAACGRVLRWPGGASTAAQFGLPAHRTLLERQQGVITHSRWSHDLLREEMPHLPVTWARMGVPLPPVADASAGVSFRQRHGIPRDAAVIGSYGFQTPMKRTEIVIRTLAHPELAHVHLMIAGEVAEILELDKVIAEVGVGGRVHVLGFLPFEDFEAAIAACDVALNLRYPTAGETSASLLRILAMGRPAIVSDYAQSADLPDSGVIKVPPGEGEEAALARQLAMLLANPEDLERMGEAARQHVASQHRLDDAAEAMVEACRRWRSSLPARDLAPSPRAAVAPPTSMMWHDLPGDLEVSGLNEPWNPGQRRQLRVRLRNSGEALWLAGERQEGGIALEVRWRIGEEVRSATAEQGWLRMPCDLHSGESHEWFLDLRKPLGDNVSLELIPHALGRDALTGLGGPSWRCA